MSISNNPDLAIPVGSLILVTGATGYIASNIVKEALDLGFKVRGTVRSKEKGEQNKKLYNSADYEYAVVPDMQPDDAHDEAVKGVDAIIHAASVVTMSSDPNKVVPPTVQGAVSILKSAIKEPKIKRFVYTSSSVSMTLPKPGKKFNIDKTMWNEEVEHYADAKPPYKDEDGFGVYSVSKVRAEREVWKFVKENKPSFVVNCILPNYNMGRVLGSAGLTGSMIQNAYNGDVNWDFPPQYMINVVDDARLHVAAAIDKSLANDRIIAFDTAFNWNDVLAIFREIDPNKEFPEPRSDQQRDLSVVANKQGAELLKKWWGQDGYVGLKESVKQTVEGL